MPECRTITGYVPNLSQTMEAYIRMWDGIEVWVPHQVHEIAAGEYRILDSDIFGPKATTCLLQFVPGDIVRLVTRLGHHYATELVSSSRTDREYWSLLYGIVIGEPPPNPSRETVERVVSEVETGSPWHHPFVASWMEKLGT